MLPYNSANFKLPNAALRLEAILRKSCSRKIGDVLQRLVDRILEEDVEKKIFMNIVTSRKGILKAVLQKSANVQEHPKLQTNYHPLRFIYKNFEPAEGTAACGNVPIEF